MVGAVISVVGKIFSRRAVKKAEQKREEALGRSRSEARNAVTKTFDSAQASLTGAIAANLSDELCKRIQPRLEEALALRGIAERAAGNQRVAVAAVKAVGSVEDPAEIFRRAVRTCQQASGMSAAELWLGESWLAYGPSTQHAASQQSLPMPPGPPPELSPAFLTALAVPPSGSGRAWLSRTRRSLAQDRRAAPILKDLYGLATAPLPRVLICGDYTTGKTSLIRRLLIDAGQEPPASLTIGGDPTTTTAAEYTWNGLTLVDSPGFQSNNQMHTAVARQAVSDAAFVIYLFNVDSVVGDQQDLRFVLCGEKERQLPGKLGHTLFAVNRCDELGANPVDSPVGFRSRQQLKRTELSQALTSATGNADSVVEPNEILMLASAPYGLQPESREDGIGFRSWDGLAEFEHIIDEVRPVLEENAADISVLHGGLARLSLLRELTRAAETDLRTKAEQLGRLASDAEAQAATGRLIVAERSRALRNHVDDYLNGLINAVWMAYRNDANYGASWANAVQRLRTWPKNRDFKDLIAGWARESARQVDQWRLATATVLGRRTASESFRKAFGVEPGEDTTGVGSPRGGGSGISGADLDDFIRVLPALGQALTDIDAASVIDIGSHFGHAIDLFDALNIADLLSELGGAVTGLSFVLQVGQVKKMFQREHIHDQEQQALIAEVKQSARDRADLILNGSPKKDGTRTKGALDAVTAACGVLDEVVRESTDDKEQAISKADAEAHRAVAYEKAMAQALACLTVNDGGVL